MLDLIRDLFFNLSDFCQPEILGIIFLFGPGGSSQRFLQGAEDKAVHPQAEGQMGTRLPKTSFI